MVSIKETLQAFKASGGNVSAFDETIGALQVQIAKEELSGGTNFNLLTDSMVIELLQSQNMSSHEKRETEKLFRIFTRRMVDSIKEKAERTLAIEYLLMKLDQYLFDKELACTQTVSNGG